MGYIDSGKKDGATVHLGGERHGTEGYFIQPTIFTDCKPEMKIVREEIFGPVAAVIKFKDEAGETLSLDLISTIYNQFLFVSRGGRGRQRVILWLSMLCVLSEHFACLACGA